MKGLNTKYITEELSNRERTYPANLQPGFFQNRYGNRMRKCFAKHCLSVDEFCEIGSPMLGDGVELKKMVSLALFDKVA